MAPDGAGWEAPSSSGWEFGQDGLSPRELSLRYLKIQQPPCLTQSMSLRQDSLVTFGVLSFAASIDGNTRRLRQRRHRK